jgi:hypothetical protein
MFVSSLDSILIVAGPAVAEGMGHGPVAPQHTEDVDSQNNLLPHRFIIGGRALGISGVFFPPYHQPHRLSLLIGYNPMRAIVTQQPGSIMTIGAGELPHLI